MRSLYVSVLLLLTSLFGAAAFAQNASKGTFADISFIEGHWKAVMPDGQTIEGVWLASEGDNTLGFMRMMRNGKADLYEILAYEQTDKGLTSMVKHFKPGLIGLEDKEKQDRYVFVEASKDRAVFQKEGDALRILYEKRSASQFVIARGNLENGKYVYKDLFVFNKVI